MTKMEMVSRITTSSGRSASMFTDVMCVLPKSSLRWKTFYPLTDTKLYRRRASARAQFTRLASGIGAGAVEVNGTFPDLRKKFAF